MLDDDDSSIPLLSIAIGVLIMTFLGVVMGALTNIFENQQKDPVIYENCVKKYNENLCERYKP